MGKYGIPYQGSKGAICDKLIQLFPKADHFYDLFGGGFAVTHAMLLNRRGDYKEFHFNELNPLNVPLIKAAIAGEFNYDKFKPKFVTKERFLEKKDTSGYVKYVWSFGNDGRTYLFGKGIEKYKQSMHQAIVFGEFDDLATETLGFAVWPSDLTTIKERRLYLRRLIEKYRVSRTLPKCLYPFLPQKVKDLIGMGGTPEQLQQLQQLQQLERLQQLEQLERLPDITFTTLSYEQAEIKPNSVVYCDPPYIGTKGYGQTFDHNTFLNWADRQTVPVYISEYSIDDPRFFEVWQVEKRKGMQQGSTSSKGTEKLYVNKAGWELLNG